MDISTTYLGLKLKNPLVVSASPITESVTNLKRLEDAGAAAVVKHSLYEEQLTNEKRELAHHLSFGTESFAEALTYFPDLDNYALGPEEYLENIRRAKEAVSIPIIGSLNCHSNGGWTDYAKHIEEAGADALELNIYFLPTDPAIDGTSVEQRTLDILKSVKASVSIPVAVKLSPYYSAMANMAKKLDQAGANGLVLFNRFYQPDIDLDNLEVVPNVLLSTPQASRLPLRWIAILYGQIKADMAATSGVHQASDVLKMLMAGANATMMCSALFKYGITHLTHVLDELKIWMEDNEYASVTQMRGSMSHRNSENPAAFERAQYMKALTTFTTHP